MDVATADQMAGLAGSPTKRRNRRMPMKAKRRAAVVVRRGSQSHPTPHVGFAQIAPWQQRRKASTTPTSIEPSIRASHFQSLRNRKRMALAKAMVIANRAHQAVGT